MDYEYFQKLLNARPFQPFAVQLSSGVIHQVRRPAGVLLTRTRLVITDAEADRIDVFSLRNVVRVEMLSDVEPDAIVGPAA